MIISVIQLTVESKGAEKALQGLVPFGKTGALREERQAGRNTVGNLQVKLGWSPQGRRRQGLQGSREHRSTDEARGGVIKLVQLNGGTAGGWQVRRVGLASVPTPAEIKKCQ